MAALSELKAPRGVDKDVIYQELVGLKRRTDTKKQADVAMERTLFGKMWRTGGGVVTAGGLGFLFGKFPNISSFANGKIDTRMVIAIPTLIGAFIAEDEIGDALEGVAYGSGLPFIYDAARKAAT